MQFKFSPELASFQEEVEDFCARVYDAVKADPADEEAWSNDGHLDEGGAGAAVLLRDRQRREVQLLGQPLPRRRVRGQLCTHRRVLGEEAPHRVAQVAQLPGSRRHRALHVSRGRPQRRSAMMLRWISLLPP